VLNSPQASSLCLAITLSLFPSPKFQEASRRSRNPFPLSTKRATPHCSTREERFTISRPRHEACTPFPSRDFPTFLGILKTSHRLAMLQCLHLLLLTSPSPFFSSSPLISSGNVRSFCGSSLLTSRLAAEAVPLFPLPGFAILAHR